MIIQVRVLSLSDNVTTFLKREDETFLTQFLTLNMRGKRVEQIFNSKRAIEFNVYDIKISQAPKG